MILSFTDSKGIKFDIYVDEIYRLITRKTLDILDAFKEHNGEDSLVFDNQDIKLSITEVMELVKEYDGIGVEVINSTVLTTPEAYDFLVEANA